MTLYKWSQTASADATADSTINWAEGQAPSSLNDSARAMMAATAKYRDDIAGAIVTGGTATAYTVSSYQVFDTLAHLGGQMIALTPHVTNGATVTLDVDSLGAKPLRTAPNTELLAGTIIQGTPYVAVYNDTDGVFYLQGFYGNPYNIPLGASLDYWLPTAPNSSFAFPYGQAISRTTYAALFGQMGTTYGSGDGTTTFNLPDLRGRVVASVDNMGGTAANLLQVSTTISTTASSTAASVASANGLAVGQYVVAAGVPTGTTVSAISGTSITLSGAATVTSSGVVARFSALSDPQALGGAGGAAGYKLDQSALPNVALSLTGAAGTVTVSSIGIGVAVNGEVNTVSGGTDIIGVQSAGSAGSASGSFTPEGTVELNGNVSQTNAIAVPPTILANKILRII